MHSPTEEIKSRLDLVEFINSYVRLQKAGVNYKALCPFHAEKTPSFFVSPSRQIWHCFGGCAKGGDIFKFVMEIEGLDFPEALRLLAQRVGVLLKREDPSLRSNRNRFYDLCEEAARVFEKSLATTPAAKSYLKNRGVLEETAREFRIGFAPQSWDFLIKALGAKGFKKEEIEKAGLAVKSEDGTSWYDRFRSRIIFPITDINGRVIGFGGRIFAPEARAQTNINSNPDPSGNEAKYVNTPNTLIYDKSRALYGFDKAKHAIRTQNSAVVVEGYMDCLMSHQAGVKNAIAVSGTALTSLQLKTLRRLCDTMISSFDTDSAGESATKRSLELADQFEFERKIVIIPSGKDPADAIQESPASWQEAVLKAKPVTEFYFEKTFQKYDGRNIEGKKAITAILLPLVAKIINEIEKAHWVGVLAQRMSLPERSLWSELNRIQQGIGLSRDRVDIKSSNSSLDYTPTRRELLEERFLSILSILGKDMRLRELQNHHLTFVSAIDQKLFNFFSGNMADDAIGVANLEEPLNLLRFKGEVISQMTKDIQQEFFTCKRELQKECIKERLLKIGAEIEQKEKSRDQIVVASLLNDFRTLSEELKLIS